jgi:hypothetical protein
MMTWSIRRAVLWALGGLAIGGGHCCFSSGGWLPSAMATMPDEPPAALAGYATYAEMQNRLQALAESPWVELSSLGKTAGQRDLWLLKVASDPQATRPAILVVGNVHASHLVGRELALRMAERLVQAGDTPAIEQLLANYTVYFIPCPTPDAAEKNFQPPARERTGNLTSTDDDRDFSAGEDPPQDLNGDGVVTMLRIAESFGTHRTHPVDPRVLIPIDPKKNEAGSYRLEIESRDLDQDKAFGEDAADGVDFNRNFTFNYPYFERGSGPHQVSEIETRAVADFMFDHPNIAFVLCFSPEDNLFQPWKGSAQTDSGRIKTKILTADQTHFDRLADGFRTARGAKNPPESPAGSGSFSEWSYFHYGRWTFASRAWWVPTVEATKPATEQEADHPPAKDQSSGGKQAAGEQAPGEQEAGQQEASEQAAATNAEVAAPMASDGAAAPLAKDDKRGAAELNALAWFQSQGIDAFVPWQAIEHPDLPGRQVEVGGFKPFYLLNPPIAQVDALIEPHIGLLSSMVENWPKLAIDDLQAKRLGPGLYDIRCQIVNAGALPTMPQMAAVNQQWAPIQVQLSGVGQAQWIQGSPRQAVGRLVEHGGKSEVRWVFQTLDAGDQEPKFTIQAVAPTLHPVQIEVPIAD